MKVQPIISTAAAYNPPRQHRAFMIIEHDKHTVVDGETGARKTLPAKQAWEMFDQIEKGGIIA